jgi:hydrogenase-4 component B
VAVTVALVIAAAALYGSSGLAAVALRRRPRAAQLAACAIACAGAALAIAAAVAVLARGEAAAPALGLRLDALSAIFLAPIALVSGLGAVYGIAYFPQESLGLRSIRLQLAYGLAAGAMVLLVAAANAILFLVAWEVMALAGFLLVHTDHDRKDVQDAALLYLASTHVGSLALFAVFALLRGAAGSFDFAAMRGLAGTGAVGAPVFLLALLGFGLKAGLVPLHFWLPGAHAAAPSHVSALMSGVLIKMGIYGLLRVTGLFDAPPAWWGVAVLAAGGLSAVLGVAFALAQHDLKRLLAYHSVENIGIIALGAGLALLGRARGEPGLVLLGMAGAGLHVVNHSLFKSLLFLGAGAVHHATGTREIDRLGGLGRAMPTTALLFVLGAAAISGLPPLNGFVSELLVMLGFLDGLGRGGDLLAFVAFGAPVLALVGGLAAACFSKVVGIVFLGAPRSDAAAHAHEAPRTMRVPMAVLAALCAAIGLAPAAVLPSLRAVAAAWARTGEGAFAAASDRATTAAWGVSVAAAALLLVVGAVALLRRRRLAAHPAPAQVETWGCGFSAPTARMQYTGSSFADLLLERFSWAIFPRVKAPALGGPFPGAASFHSHAPDTVLDLALLPVARAYAWVAFRARLLYLRRIHFQILLVIVTLLAVLAWAVAG